MKQKVLKGSKGTSCWGLCYYICNAVECNTLYK